MEKRFYSLFPRSLRTRAKMAWRNNPPEFVPTSEGEEKSKVMSLLLNHYLKLWWKGGGHKKVLKKVLRS